MVTFLDCDPLQAEGVDALLLRELTALVLEATPADLVAHALATEGNALLADA